MERENRQEALEQLLQIAVAQGYITFDDIFECADAHSLSIGDFDWLSEAATSRQVIIYDKAPQAVTESDEEYDDYAQIDYEVTFQEILEIEPSLKPFIDSIRAIKPPQRGELSRIKYQVIEGNAHARTRMIEMYTRLALRIALQRAKAFDLNLEETIGDACLGLLIAVDRYDPDSSGPFASFASIWIFQTITREQPTTNPHIYFPVHRKEDFYTMYPLYKKRGCIECDEFGSCEKVLDMTVKKVGGDSSQAFDLVIASMSYESYEEVLEKVEQRDSLYEEEGFWVSLPEDRVFYTQEEDDTDSIIEAARHEELYKVLSRLDERARKIIIARYGLDGEGEKTLEQVGRMFWITRERVRQIEKKSLRKMLSSFQHMSSSVIYTRKPRKNIRK